MNHPKTIAISHDDFSAWHKQRTQFGLWYVLVDDEMADFCAKARKRYQRFLHHDYRRQFHLTLFASGFVVAHKRYHDDIDEADIQRQTSALSLCQLSPFQLQTDGVGMFDNSLHIRIRMNDDLLRIRQTLQSSTQEISPTIYQPHITLGLFSDEFDVSQVQQFIHEQPLGNRSFWVDRLIFGTYEPTDMQGRLSARQQLILD